MADPKQDKAAAAKVMAVVTGTTIPINEKTGRRYAADGDLVELERDEFEQLVKASAVKAA